MSIVGLITEYNPFHLGHKYHIEQAKRLTGADTAIVIMSGSYVQRGEPSFLDKYTKTKIALNNGADMVIELPCCFACASAEYFAYGAVSVLDKLGIVDFLCFGAENDDMGTLFAIARILSDEPDLYCTFLNEFLRQGASFAYAREAALIKYIEKLTADIERNKKYSQLTPDIVYAKKYSQLTDDNISVLKDADIHGILSAPNNILAIEYLKALLKRKSKIKPVALKRINACYHDNTSDSRFYSAAAIRKLAEHSYDDLKYTLEQIDSDYLTSFMSSFPVFTTDYSAMSGYSLRTHIFNGTLNNVFGMTRQLSNRIRKNIDDFTDIVQFTDMLKTKDLSYTAVSRALLHCVLDIFNDDMSEYMNNDVCSFVRILGFSSEHEKVFKLIKSSSDMEIITGLAGYESNSRLNSTDKKLIKNSIYCDSLYRMICRQKYNSKLPTEYTSFIQKL